MNGHTSNSAGLITLFNNKYEVQHVESDGIGRRLIVVLEDESSKFIVANSYLPNDHRAAIDNVEALYTNILDVKSKYNDHIMISGGDFNVCLNVLDHLNRKISIQENELAKSITENNKLLGLKDSFREERIYMEESNDLLKAGLRFHFQRNCSQHNKCQGRLGLRDF